jgi:hypothetical protein
VNKVLLSLLFFLLVQPAYAKWVLISKDGQGNSYFYEDTKVVLNPGAEQVSAWQMISYEERMSAPNGESIYSVIQDISYFCRPGYESSFISVTTQVAMVVESQFKTLILVTLTGSGSFPIR